MQREAQGPLAGEAVSVYMSMHLHIYLFCAFLEIDFSSPSLSLTGRFLKQSIKKGRRDTYFLLQQVKAIRRQILTVPGSKFF